jgi:hypothetical protein
MNLYKKIINRLFKKDKIKFHCELPEVKEKYPIIPASSYKFKWVKESAMAFKEVIAKKGSYEQVTGVVKCPGVFPIMKKGYIVQTWFDVTIRPLNDGRFECHIPLGILSYLKERNFDKKLISWFSSDEPSHAIPLSIDQIQSLIKITLPWTISIPKGWELLFIPIPYPDLTPFTAVHGILEASEFYHLNAIIKINQRYEEFTIPAGTPLLQLIPIKSDTVEVEILDYDESVKQLEIKNHFASNNTFVIKK